MLIQGWMTTDVATVHKDTSMMKASIVMKEKKIKPELEVFDLGMVSFATYLERKALLEDRKYFNFRLYIC